MPELPEVETIARHLRQGRPGSPPVVGKTILSARLTWQRTLARPEPEEFHPRIQNQVIADIERRGKFLILRLSRDSLLFHLRMSGDLLVEPYSEVLNPYHRLVLDLDGGLQLAFHDTRKFGRAWLVSDPLEVTGALGPEPLDPALTVEEFALRLRQRRRQLKPLLLDQSFLAGLGNIYTVEALHLARLHPLALSSDLTFEQSARLLDAIRQVLSEGIRLDGASIDWVYRRGSFQNTFRVYDRAGSPCPECGTPIIRILVGQRGTYLCPTCQPASVRLE